MNEQPKKEDGSCCSKKISCLLCCVCICATICLVTYFLRSPSGPSRRLWLPVVVETNGNQTILGDTRQFEFWTPSSKTKEFLHKDGNDVVATEKWEALSSEDAVSQFGATLHTNRNVLGYRRVEVFGQGRTVFKPGWWWTVNVLSNCTPAEMGRTYQDFWKSSQALFVEVIDSRGHGE